MKTAFVAPLAAALSLTVAAGPAAQQGVILQKIVVRVNGEIFTQSDLEFQWIQNLRDQNRQVKSSVDLATDPGLRAAVAEITPRILLQAVDELLLVQHAREIGVKFSEEIFQGAIEDIKKTNNITDDATFQAALKGEGMTLSDFRMTMEREFLKQSVTQRELARNMTLTDEEMRQYYRAHPEQFMKPPTVTLREIFVAVPTETFGGQTTVNAAAEEAAKQKIADARARALKGEDYAKLVAEVSESGTKAGGGLIGPINLADLSEAISTAIAKLKAGEISEPMRTRTGYQIIKLETLSTAEPVPFENAKDQIQQRILEGRIDVERAKLIERLRSQAVIEWKDEAYRKMYETALAERNKK
jgi:parvulin-like peptidyl-prolyl isomerase